MFNVGDLVVIQPEKESLCMTDSPALNLKGSTCRIADIVIDRHLLTATYHLEMVDLHAKKPELYEKEQMNMAWKDRHFVPYYEIREFDTMDVIMSG